MNLQLAVSGKPILILSVEGETIQTVKEFHPIAKQLIPKRSWQSFQKLLNHYMDTNYTMYELLDIIKDERFKTPIHPNLEIKVV